MENFVNRRDEAAVRPKREFVPKTLADLHAEGFGVDDVNGASTFHVPLASSSTQNHNNTQSNQNNLNYWSQGDMLVPY